MSITSSFYSGLSGLDTHATAMQVIGDNIANVKTTGFKSSSAHFEDVLGVSLTGVGGANQTGAGAKVSAVDGNFIQGSMETTDVGTDVAINGKGLFVLKSPDTNEDFFTRAGHFTVDNQGYYVNNEGLRVQGYLYDTDGVNLIQNLADIQINQTTMIQPKVTGEIAMKLNLDAGEAIKTFDIADPSNTSNFSAALTIYDSLGQSHQVQVYFTKTADQVWDWNAVIDGSDVQGGTPGTGELYGNGTLNFDNTGTLTTLQPLTFYTGALTFANGIIPAASTVDFSETTQFGSPSSILALSQDGYTAGNVSGVSIDEKGNLVAHYTNGKVKKIAQLSVADFPSLTGLQRVGGSLYRATTQSGDAMFGKPGLGGLGTISSSMLEESNVDLAAEFIKMIIIQRGYQANSKVIGTTDEMLAQLINIR
jgi:flagellar hook protein FlgE